MRTGTQFGIIESLRMRREGAANITYNINRKPRLALQIISERKILLIKESGFKDMSEMPMGKLKDPVIIAYSNGYKYAGEVRDTLPDGEGTIASPQGDMYTGSWKNGRPHGYGNYLWANGDIFSGMWVNGAMHGEGEFYMNGKEYKGEWKNGELMSTEGLICDKITHREKNN